MASADRYVKLYYIEEEYDAHSIIHMLENILKIEYKSEKLYKGQIISVKKEDYYKALNFITSELLRREPEYKVNRIDAFGKQKPYNEFCYGILKLRDEYIDSMIMKLAKDKLTELMNDKANTLDGRAPISVTIDDNGLIYFGGNIIYDDREKFWSDLRYYNLAGTFAQRREYCLNIIQENSQTIGTYAKSYYLPVLDGKPYVSEEMDYEFTTNGIEPKQKIKK